jgi:hypothetical protein
MNSASKHAVTALLVVFATGCAPKNAKTAPPAQAQAPAIPPAGKAGAMYPPPLTESQTQTEPATPAPAPEVAKTEPAPAPPPTPPPSTKKTTHKPKPSAAKPAGTDSGSTTTASSEAASSSSGAAATPGDPTAVAANAEPTAASPIGELTPGDTPGQAEKGKETNDLITNTENGLNAIKRPLSTQEQETVNQIKTFLTKAKTALTNQDLDGAYVLATKAKVLLDELNKS